MKPQDLQDQTDQFLAELAALTDQTRATEAFQRYLELLGRFHKYSWNNVLLILMQSAEATHVAGYKTWAALGRQVRQGEKGIGILCPAFKKKTEDDGAEERQLAGFRVGYVFDISQTEGEPLPAAPEWSNAGDAGAGLVTALQTVAAAHDISVTQVDRLARAGALGANRQGTLTLLAGLSPLGEAAALAHLLAGELLRQQETAADSTPAGLQLEAEAAAYAICRHFGLDTNSPNYLALWNATGAALLARLQRIGQVARYLIQSVYTATGGQGPQEVTA